MIERTCYKAFGLVLESEFPLIQLPRIPAQVSDVRIVRERDLPKHFQRCVMLSTKISTDPVTRTDGAGHSSPGSAAL